MEGFSQVIPPNPKQIFAIYFSTCSFLYKIDSIKSKATFVGTPFDVFTNRTRTDVYANWHQTKFFNVNWNQNNRLNLARNCETLNCSWTVWPKLFFLTNLISPSMLLLIVKAQLEAWDFDTLMFGFFSYWSSLSN